MKATPKISNAEWEVMKVIWTNGPLTANQIIDSLPKGTKWHPKTVKTLINRLSKKGALSHTKQGREYVYKPLAAEKESVRTAFDSFMKRVFDGAFQPMLAHFVERKKLSPKEVQELKTILDSAGKAAKR